MPFTVPGSRGYNFTGISLSDLQLFNTSTTVKIKKIEKKLQAQNEHAYMIPDAYDPFFHILQLGQCP